MKSVEWCFVPRVLSYDSGVLVGVRFQIRSWDDAGLHYAGLSVLCALLL